MSRRRVDLNIQAAVRCAEEELARLAIRTLPVDPLAIAKGKGITIAAAELEGCSGCLMRDGEAFGILYSNTLRNEGFEHFTIAHELGHYFLPGHPEALFKDGGTVHRSHSGFVSQDLHEREADHFAASFLMPEASFRAALRAEKADGFPAIERLAALCKTSLTATALRFARFADDPVAVIMSHGCSVDWCEMSEPLYDLRRLTWLRNGSPLPREGTTAKFNRKSENIAAGAREEGTSLLSDWFDGAPDVEMMEDVVGLGGYGRTLTVLFTKEALDDETEEDDGD